MALLLFGLAEHFAASGQYAGMFFSQLLLSFGTNAHFRGLVVVETGSGGDQVPQDDVFLQT